MIFSGFWNKSKPILAGNKKILVVTSSHTGNNIFCTPAIKFLKKHSPDTILDVVSLNKLSAQVFVANPSVNQVYVSKSSRFINKLAKNYAQVICLHREVLKMLPGLDSSFIVAPDYIDGIHRAEHMLKFVADFVKREIAEEDRAYVIVGDDMQTQALEAADIAPNDILVCMHFGCGRTKTHGWNFFKKSARTHRKLLPIQAYVDFANSLIKQNSNIRIVITGTKNEKFLGDAFAKQVPRTINLIAKTTIPQLYQLMSEFKLFVSQDCGILHVASASSVPILGLFGPTNPLNTGPYPLKSHHKIIKEDSMSQISTDAMQSAALNLLNIPKQYFSENVILPSPSQLIKLHGDFAMIHWEAHQVAQ